MKIFNTFEPLNRWLDKTKLSQKEYKILKEDSDFIEKINKTNIQSDLDLSEYNVYKEKIFKKCNLNDDFDLVLNTSARKHIKYLFDENVDKDTLVVLNMYSHQVLFDYSKNYIFLDDETSDEKIEYKIDYVINESKKYKKVFVVITGISEFMGTSTPDDVIIKLKNEFEKENINYVLVLDDAQGMFLYKRNYSIYDYIVGTVHTLYPSFDTGLLFYNKKYDINTGYKRGDILKKINTGYDIILKRNDLLVKFKEVINECINYDFFKKYHKINSEANFFNVYYKSSILYNPEFFNVLVNDFFKNDIDSYITFAVIGNKSKKLCISIRAQKLLYNDYILNNLDDFIENIEKIFNKLEKHILFYDMKSNL